MVKMGEFVAEHDLKGKTVVDIGSRDINGTYRELFPESNYFGVDIVEGPNVDIIMDSKEWNELKNVDVVISGQTLEHVINVTKLMKSIWNVLKPGGIICIIAPSAGPMHEPPWTGNFSEARMRDVVSKAGFEVLSCTIHPVGPWHDNCCIAVKAKENTTDDIAKNK